MIRFFGVKVNDYMSLDRIATYFKMNRSLKWIQYIYLDNDFIRWTLNANVEDHQCFIYEYGVICFVNFYEEEMRQFLSIIETIETISYEKYSRMYDAYRINYQLDKGIELYSGAPLIPIEVATIRPLIASVLSKSIALNHVEGMLTDMIESVEPLLNSMGSGRFRVNKKAVQSFGKVLGFKYHLVRHLKLFDRIHQSDHSVELKQVYDTISNHFELEDRYQIIEKKIEEIKNITNQYYALGHSNNEQRLLLFEAIILALFPIAGLISHGYILRFIAFILE